MSETYPPNPIGSLPSETLRVFRALKALPDGYRVWHRLAPWQPDAPDFLVRDPDGRVLVAAVSPASVRDARPAAQLLLIGEEAPPLGGREAAILERFFDRVSGAGERAARSVVSAAVLFPNVPQGALDRARPAGYPPEPAWLGQETISAGDPDGWLAAFRGDPAGEDDFERLRAAFCPEVVVPADLTVREGIERRLEAGLAGFLLDYDQEAALKADLELPGEGAGLGGDFRVNVVNGVTGSGKSLILLHRLRLLHGLYPDKRYLVLTHNRPLKNDLRDRYRRLTGERPQGIEWQTFNGWCRKHWPDDPAWSDPIGEKTRMALIEELLRADGDGVGLTPWMLRSEIDWLKDNLIFDRRSYVEADRRGRGFRLSAVQREGVFELVVAYQKQLQERGRGDWGDVPRRMWNFIRDERVRPEPYDVVLVDEAQFFAPLWFDIVRGLVTARSGHLFIVADPAQGFLGRGTSWKSLGLEVRGHTHRLGRSYRTTSEILSFATLFYRQRNAPGLEDEDVVQADLTGLPPGVVPQLLPMGSSQDEIARVVNEVAAFAGQGLPLRDLLVLHAHGRGAADLVRALNRKLGAGKAGDPGQRAPGDYVRVTTVNAGAGLESPIVFLVGLNQLFEGEQNLRLSDEEREQLVRENTSKVYMAATRAGQRLVVTYVGDLGPLVGLLQ